MTVSASEAGEGIRTPGLPITNRVLYQLSYSGARPSHAAFRSVHQKVHRQRIRLAWLFSVGTKRSVPP